jgi:hypothetical protein
MMLASRTTESNRVGISKQAFKKSQLTYCRYPVQVNLKQADTMLNLRFRGLPPTVTSNSPSNDY